MKLFRWPRESFASFVNGQSDSMQELLMGNTFAQKMGTQSLSFFPVYAISGPAGSQPAGNALQTLHPHPLSNVFALIIEGSPQPKISLPRMKVS